MEKIESEIELAYTLHNTCFKEANLDVQMPNESEVESALGMNSTVVETVEQGGGLLFVPLNVERQRLAKGVSRVLSSNPDLRKLMGEVPITESAEITISKSRNKLLINPWSYNDDARRKALLPDKYEAKKRLIPGWDILAVTSDGLKSNIPRRFCNANIAEYYRAIRSGVLKGAIGTYKEYMMLLMIKSLGGEIIDRRSRSWLPNAFLSDVGRVATARFVDGGYVLGAHEPTKLRQFGVRPVVRLQLIR